MVFLSKYMIKYEGRELYIKLYFLTLSFPRSKSQKTQTFCFKPISHLRLNRISEYPFCCAYRTDIVILEITYILQIKKYSVKYNHLIVKGEYFGT